MGWYGRRDEVSAKTLTTHHGEVSSLCRRERGFTPFGKKSFGGTKNLMCLSDVCLFHRKDFEKCSRN